TPIYVASYYSFLGELEQLQERAQGVGNERLKLQLFHKIQKAKRMLIEKECSLEGIFKKHITNLNGRYIVFCSNEERLLEAMGTCEEWFVDLDVKVHKYQVLSTYKNSKQEFQAFEEDESDKAIKLLFCVDMLNEGIHVAGIEGVIMLRTTESLNVYYQQLGRALTCMGDSKKRPLIFDLVNNFENGNAGPLGEEVLYQLCAEMAEGDSEIDFELYDYMVDLRQALEDVKNTFEKSWDYNYESVKVFCKEKKRFPYNREMYHGIDLGSWCIVQRRQYQSGVLYKERITLLEDIGFPWNPREDAWSIRYQELCNYVEQHGRTPKSTEDISLYNWLAKQKKLYKIGQLEKDREALLLNLRVELIVQTPEETWQKRLQVLEDFINEKQKLPQTDDTWQGIPIGMWLVEQRSLGRSGKLTLERQAMLEERGVIFQERKDRAFWENLELLKAFYIEESRFPNTTEKYEGFGLGVWCSRVREDHKVGKLNKEQIEVLQGLGFDLRSTNEIRLEQRWDQYYVSVKEFIEEKGRLPKGREDQNLYKWVKKQRQVQGSGRLTTEQVERLREIAVVR
ncbi:MAG: Helicase associated domain protein, partial [Eubacteriales bacterium]